MVSDSKVKSKKNKYTRLLNCYSSSFSNVILYKDAQWSCEACCDWPEKPGRTRSTCPRPSNLDRLRCEWNGGVGEGRLGSRAAGMRCGTLAAWRQRVGEWRFTVRYMKILHWDHRQRDRGRVNSSTGVWECLGGIYSGRVCQGSLHSSSLHLPEGTKRKNKSELNESCGFVTCTLQTKEQA